MSPGTFHFFHRAEPDEDHGSAWAAIIAVLFAAVAAISFAVDQSVAVSNVSGPPTQNSGR